ncbi:MAG TPA: cupin domain-containing protein [Gaiellaceae bacterium]|nr:cupin domain-containing protein [Gaiellaceae bacterium]
MIAHWDEVEAREREVGPMAGRWTALGAAAGSVGVGVNRIELPEGRLSTPVHVHRREEEIFFVLGGAGLLWQDGRTCELRAGDTVVCAPGGPAHTLIGGRGGLDVLAFGPRLAGENGFLPRVGIAWVAGRGVQVEERHPWEIEAEAGVPEGEPGERPANVVNVDEVEGDYGGLWKRMGAAAGSTRTGLSWAHLPPHEEGAPPHVHTVEEELYVVLDGEGAFELWERPQPGAPFQTAPSETHTLRAGHVVARPPGGRAACLRTGERPMTYLAYGTRDAADVCYYPRSNKVFFRGIGLIARLEPLAYDDGEPS